MTTCVIRDWIQLSFPELHSIYTRVIHLFLFFFPLFPSESCGNSSSIPGCLHDQRRSGASPPRLAVAANVFFLTQDAEILAEKRMQKSGFYHKKHWFHEN